jgi:hypothetical protein
MTEEAWRQTRIYLPHPASGHCHTADDAHTLSRFASLHFVLYVFVGQAKQLLESAACSFLLVEMLLVIVIVYRWGPNGLILQRSKFPVVPVCVARRTRNVIPFSTARTSGAVWTPSSHQHRIDINIHLSANPPWPKLHTS